MSALATRDETRARILKVALDLMAEHGFAATSTREVSERLGFTKAALYYHFRTKDDLLAALIAPALKDLEALIADVVPRPSAAARRDLLRGFLDLVAAHENLIRVLAEDPSVKRRPAVERAQPIFDRLIQLLTGQDEPDTTQRTRALVALGGMQTALLNAAPSDDRDAVHEAALIAACGALGIPASRQSHAR